VNSTKNIATWAEYGCSVIILPTIRSTLLFIKKSRNIYLKGCDCCYGSIFCMPRDVHVDTSNDFRSCQDAHMWKTFQRHRFWISSLKPHAFLKVVPISISFVISWWLKKHKQCHLISCMQAVFNNETLVNISGSTTGGPPGSINPL